MTDATWKYENFEPAGSAIGYRIVRKLDAILSNVYQPDPVKLAGWKAARRVERAPRRAAKEPAPGDGGSTPPSGS